MGYEIPTHIKTSQLMCKTNLLNGSYMAITFVVDGLSVDGLGLTEFFVDL